MQAMIATRYGTPDVLQLQEVEKPIPHDNEILIKVRATTVNVGDLRMRSFTVPPMFWLPARLTLGLQRLRHPILGMELAGDVEAVGRAVQRFKPGDQVFGSTFESNFGAHAQYKCLPADGAVALKPANLSYTEAATLSIGAHTALHFLQAANLQPGQKVLIYGASGGVGTFALQLARHLGAEVTGVCGPRNVALVQALGADHVIDYTQADFARAGETYDVIFDTVGKTTFVASQPALKPGGYYLSTVLEGAAIQQWLYARTTKQHLVGGTAVPRRAGLALLKELAEAGQLKPVIDRCYPLAQLAEAHRYVEQGHKRGNVVVAVEPSL